MGCTVLPSYWTQTWSALPAMFHAINAFMQMERKCVREHLWIDSILSYVQNSEIQPRASSLGLHVQEMKMTPVCLQPADLQFQSHLNDSWMKSRITDEYARPLRSASSTSSCCHVVTVWTTVRHRDASKCDYKLAQGELLSICQDL